MKTARVVAAFVMASSLLLLAACGDDDNCRPAATATPTSTTPTPTRTPDGELDISICAPSAAPFSTTIDNPFFPLPVGTKWVLEGEEEDDEGEIVEIRVEITSLDEIEVVASVTTRVVEEREWEDDELVEVSRNFFVQTSDGTVCYYGEDVDDYEDGEIVGHEGAWRAGIDGALPGILIPGNPQVGQSFQQEFAPGVAEDRAVQVAAGETVEVELGTFTDTIRYEESSPLDIGTSEKIYARGIGLIVDDVIERIADEMP